MISTTLPFLGDTISDFLGELCVNSCVNSRKCRPPDNPPTAESNRQHHHYHHRTISQNYTTRNHQIVLFNRLFRIIPMRKSPLWPHVTWLNRRRSANGWQTVRMSKNVLRISQRFPKLWQFSVQYFCIVYIVIRIFPNIYCIVYQYIPKIPNDQYIPIYIVFNRDMPICRSTMGFQDQRCSIFS